MTFIKKLDDYIVDSLINKGTFGCIYKCHKNCNIYAIKEDINIKLLKHEADIYRSIKNVKNISKLIDFFSFNNKYYLVLDYFEYSLKQYKTMHYNSKVYSYHVKLTKIFSSLVTTLENIHTMGIIHRDLKPDNICFNQYNEPYIIDFGLAKSYKNVEILWASVREPYNYLQSKQIGCHIITIPPSIIQKIEKFGKTFDQLTKETVNAFLVDSKKSRFKI